MCSRVLLSLLRPASVPAFFVLFLRRRLANDFRSGIRAFRAVIRVSYFSMREYAQDAGATSIDIGDLAGAAILLDGGDGAICYPFLGTVT